MKKIALTGVMGAGKSSVIRILKQLDIPVFDCDAINGELLQKGAKGHAALVRTYGDAVLDAQGNIDRSALSDLMFAKGKKTGSGSAAASAHQAASAGSHVGMRPSAGRCGGAAVV